MCVLNIYVLILYNILCSYNRYMLILIQQHNINYYTRFFYEFDCNSNYYLQVQNFVDELINMISVLENKHNQRAIIYEWIEEEMVTLNKMKEKPTRINVDGTAQEITNLNEILHNVNDKKLEIAELVLDDTSDKLVTDLDNLTYMVNLVPNYLH